MFFLASCTLYYELRFSSCSLSNQLGLSLLIVDEISLLIFYSQREVPSSNIALHSAHCARNLQKCEHCGDMVARKLMDEHYDENHAPVYF
jgi:hypothetical protein